MTNKQTSGEGLPFENALHRLEGLIESMETEQQPLEELITNYEEGIKLVSHCEQILSQAQTRIQAIRVDQLQSSTENHSDEQSDDASATETLF